MLRSDFEYLLKNKVLFTEGSLHAEVQRRAKTASIFVPRVTLDTPDLIRDVHRAYAEAGATLFCAGSAEANEMALQRKHLAPRMEEINRTAVALARDVLPPQALLFGGLGPSGALLKPYGPLSEEDYQGIFIRQAEILLDEQVDGFILESFSSLIEAEQAILGLREMSSKPIIATMTFLEDGLTRFGDSIADCFRTLLKAGADVVGIHGTLGPLEIDAFLEQLTEPYPLAIRPNAGYPVRIGNINTYLSSPEYVAECAEMFLERGAVIIGGAAGFTPDHIRAVTQRLAGRTPITPKQEPPNTHISQTIRDSDGKLEKQRLPHFMDKLGKEPILSVEIEPPHGLEINSTLHLLERLIPYGVDVVNIPENPLARARISSIALAKAIQERTGLDSITHLTCRDRNLISLQAELLGAHVLGVQNILALTGDPSGVGDYPSATGVFDVDSQGLVEIMARMNIGKDFGMNELGEATHFNIGVAANPLAEDLSGELNRLEAKLKRGATFIQTQPIFDPSRLKAFMKAIAPYKVPVIFGVMLVRSYRHAKFLNNEYPGIAIRPRDVERFRGADEKRQRHQGIQLACELIQELSSVSGGIYLMTSLHDSERLEDILRHLRGED